MKKFAKTLLLTLCVMALCISMAGCAKPEACEPSGNYADYDAYNKADGYSDNIAYSQSGKTDYGTDVPSQTGDNKVSADESRMIIRVVSITCETKEFDKVLDQIVTDVKAYGGYFETMDLSSNYKNARHETLVIRVPKAFADEFLAGVKGAVNVLRETESSTDVTLSYADVESKLAALNVQQTRLLELMETAKNLDEILTLEDKLTDVRYQLEKYESQRRLMENRVEYVTVNMSLSEVEKETVTEKPTLGSRMGKGFMNCVEGLGEIGEEFLIFLASIAPALIVIGLIVLIVLLLTARRRKEKKAAKKAKKEAAEKEEA